MSYLIGVFCASREEFRSLFTQ